MKNNRSILSSYELGDMTVCYMHMDNGLPEMILFPGKTPNDFFSEQNLQGESLVQIKLLDDAYPGAYANGTSMRNSGTLQRMTYQGQTVEETPDAVTIRTTLCDDRGYTCVHMLSWIKGEYSLESSVRFENNSSDSVTLEMLSSFSLRGFTAFARNAGSERMLLHRIRSRWSAEGRLVSETPEDLQLEPSWSGWGMNSVRYGQIGSMPVKGYFPFGAIEDTEEKIVWAAQLAIEGSWQMEFYRRDDDLAFSGGLADREFGHWMKTIHPRESFETPLAILTVVRGTLDEACQRLTFHGRKYFNRQPESEERLPVLFNEYCTTWGLPSHDHIHNILQSIKGHGITYFVVDCGWFVEEGKSWGDGMGDYIPSAKLFPQGLGALAQEIRAAGMLPGIWYEIDNVGKDARVYQMEDMLLHRDGRVLSTENRRFFDMRKQKVIDYLTEKVIRQLRSSGFSYMKMDYNDTIGIGCDGAESLGEGLRQDRAASVDFVRKIKKELPGIILENCASGGHKLEPLMMSLCSMASFSDAHEAPEIPVIALALHRLILPSQSQIWAVIRKTDSLQRIAYTMANTFLGRMCLSGDMTDLSPEQWKQIDDAITFYRLIAPAVKTGFSYLYENRGISDRNLSGWQALVRIETEETDYRCSDPCMAYAVIHHFGGLSEKEIRIPLPEGCPLTIQSVYTGTKAQARIEGNILTVTTDVPMEAIAVYMK